MAKRVTAEEIVEMHACMPTVKKLVQMQGVPQALRIAVQNLIAQ